jgi:hypothetical protein
MIIQVMNEYGLDCRVSQFCFISELMDYLARVVHVALSSDDRRLTFVLAGCDVLLAG